MNRALAAGALTVALLGTQAIAADMRIFKTPAPKEPSFVVYNWTGFYAGIEGGMGWGPVRQTDATGFFSGTYQDTGGLVGGTLGVNAQFGAVVLGLEGDYSHTWVHDMTIGTDPVSGNCGGMPARCELSLPWLATFRGRVGYAMDNVMPYVTGGLSVTSLHGLEGDGAVSGRFGSGSKTVPGWNVGVGIEAMFNARWSAKAEYLYGGFGNHEIFNDNVAGVTVPQHLEVKLNVLRVGLNYRFGY